MMLQNLLKIFKHKGIAFSSAMLLSVISIQYRFLSLLCAFFMSCCILSKHQPWYIWVGGVFVPWLLICLLSWDLSYHPSFIFIFISLMSFCLLKVKSWCGLVESASMISLVFSCYLLNFKLGFIESYLNELNFYPSYVNFFIAIISTKLACIVLMSVYLSLNLVSAKASKKINRLFKDKWYDGNYLFLSLVLLLLFLYYGYVELALPLCLPISYTGYVCSFDWLKKVVGAKKSNFYYWFLIIGCIHDIVFICLLLFCLFVGLYLGLIDLIKGRNS